MQELQSKKPVRYAWSRNERFTPFINQYLQRIIEFDFLKMVDKKETGYFYKGKNNLLVSPTSLCHTISRHTLAKIPEHILLERKEIGLNLMANLKMMFDNKIYDVSDMPINQRDRTMIYNLMDWLQQEKIKVLAVEKFITNGTFCGFVDMIAKWNNCICVFEIKCRNNKEVRLTDVVQSTIYSHMLKKVPTYIVLLADNGEVTFYNAPRSNKTIHYGKFKKIMNFYNEMGVIDEKEIQPIEI